MVEILSIGLHRFWWILKSRLSKMISKLATRFLYTQDHNRILEINDGFYNAKELLKLLKERWCVGLVATDTKNILGFCIYGLQNPDCFNILHLIIDKKHYRNGVASKIINKMKSKLNQKRNYIQY